MIEGLLAFGTEREIMGPVLRDAVFGSTVEALHYEFVQRGTTPAANRSILQSVPYDTVLLPASEATDNKVVLKHLDSRFMSVGGRVLHHTLRPSFYRGMEIFMVPPLPSMS